MMAAGELQQTAYIPPGEYDRRVVAINFNLSGWVDVTCGEDYSDG